MRQSNLPQFAGWAGAAALAAAPFFLPHPAAMGACVVGLLLLTIQSVKNRLHNLTFLNIIGALGYAVSLARMLL